MSKIIKNISVLMLLLFISSAFGQAKKPIIMVIPSDVWMNKQGFMKEFNVMGETKKYPDYKRALQEDADLKLVITKLNELMAERGFPLKSMEATLKKLEQNAAEDAMTSSKSGAELTESPLDALKKTAKADIVMDMTWTVNQVGPKKSVTFILAGLDAYSSKQVAGASGTGNELIGATMPVMLETSVLSYLDGFNAQLMTHFNDMAANGREIVVSIKVWDSWENDLEAEYGDDEEELSYIIEDWMAANTVSGRFSTTDATESMMIFEQVRIPLMNEKGRAMDARRFGKGLRTMLKKEPYLITSKMMTRGLGEVVIVLGEK
jgi:hypothetical protein